jgi:hypothetical protein
VTDITESEIAEALWHIISACEEKTTLNPEAMNVEPGSPSNVISMIKDTPSLASFLESCVNYNITPSKLRQALRREHSSSAPEHALPVLRVLIDWWQVWLKRDVELSAANSMHSQAKGNSVPDLKRVRNILARVLCSDWTTRMTDCFFHRNIS